MDWNSFEGVSTIDVNGTSLAYREEGEGDPVVFVHGGITDLRAWEHNVPEVGRRHRAITYSRRYARPNVDIDRNAPDPWQLHADDLAALLPKLGAAPAHLVANSQGAFISLLVAIQHPDLVRCLVLEEPPVVPLFVSVPPRPTEILKLLVTRPRTAVAMIESVSRQVMPVRRAFESGDDDAGLRRFVITAIGQKAYEALSEESWARFEANVSTLRAGMLHDMFPPLDDAMVRGVRVPTLLLTGQNSPAFLLRLTDRLEELLPNVERAEIPNASHVMHEDNPAATNSAILDFLERRGANASTRPS